MSYRIAVPPLGSSGNCVTQWRRSLWVESREANLIHHRLTLNSANSLIWGHHYTPPPLGFVVENFSNIFIVSNPIGNLLQQAPSSINQLPLFLCVCIPVVQDSHIHMERHQNYPSQFRYILHTNHNVKIEHENSDNNHPLWGYNQSPLW